MVMRSQTTLEEQIANLLANGEDPSMIARKLGKDIITVLHHAYLPSNKIFVKTTMHRQKLTPEARDFVQACFAEGASPQRIASELGVDVRTISYHKPKKQSQLPEPQKTTETSHLSSYPTPSPSSHDSEVQSLDQQIPQALPLSTNGNTLEQTAADPTSFPAVATKTPYTPQNVASLPTRRASTYKPTKEKPMDLPELSHLVGDQITQESFRAQTLGRLEALYTGLVHSIRLWNQENYTGIFEIHKETVPPEQDIKRTAAIYLDRLATSLGDALTFYERTLQNRDRFQSAVEADLEFLTTIRGPLTRIRELQQKVLNARLLTHQELHQE